MQRKGIAPPAGAAEGGRRCAPALARLMGGAGGIVFAGHEKAPDVCDIRSQGSADRLSGNLLVLQQIVLNIAGNKPDPVGVDVIHQKDVGILRVHLQQQI